MSNFEDSITQIAALYTDSTVQNGQIIKSHSLEILISFSDSDEFMKILNQNPEFVGALAASASDPYLVHKALVLLMNLSANVKLSQILSEKSLVKQLFEIITETMKDITPQHLALEQQFFSQEGSTDPEVKVLIVSKDKISSKDLPYMLAIEKIKQSIFVLINLTKHSEKAREDVLQYQTALECINVLNVLDWLLNASLKHLFADFVDVLVNISTDSKLRSILIDQTMKKIFELFNTGLLSGDINFIIKVYGIVRNLSFEPKNLGLLKMIECNVFAQQNLSILQSTNVNPKDKETIASSFVDTYLALLTSENFMNGEGIEANKVFTAGFIQAVELARNSCTDPKSELNERSEALVHIIQEYDESKEQ